MTLTETLKLLHEKEKRSGVLLRNAIHSSRDRSRSILDIIDSSHAFYLPAVNAKARSKWGTIFVREVFNYCYIRDNEPGPRDPVFLVTLVDKSLVTPAQAQKINLAEIKAKLRSGLQELSYLGMIEPGYYNNIYNPAGESEKDVVSWHGHFLVWGIAQKELKKHLKRIKSRFTPVVPHLQAVHQKRIEPDQFGYKLWYIIKSPCKEYSIGKRIRRDKNKGLFKQNSRSIRSGHRVKLFYLMRDMYLDQLAMAGGQGRSVLAKIKYEALADYRRKCGWGEKRP